MFGQKNQGIDLINTTLNQFQKVKTDLQNGVLKCQEDIKTNESKILELTNETTQNEDSINKAEKAISNIEKLLGE